jgi:hypothetical protein
MRIALRTSGGRGEYELAGRQGTTQSTALQNLLIDFEIAPGIVLPSFSRMIFDPIQKKPRIRLAVDVAPDAVHAYRLFAAVLLLPPSIRELGKTPTGPLQLEPKQYSITGIDVDVVSHGATAVLLRPKALHLGNRSSNCVFPFAARYAAVVDLWQQSSILPPPLTAFVNAHRTAICAGSPSHTKILATATALRKAIETSAASSVITAALDSALEDWIDPTIPDTQAAVPDAEEDPSTPKDSMRSIIRIWRRIVSRGASGQAFSRRVKESYRFTCLMSGRTLPAIDKGYAAGVDAAHILPWASSGINAITNGLCLDKLSHWAFDCGLLRLDWDGTQFAVSIPKERALLAAARNVDIAYLASLSGPVPEARLPSNKKLWPDPEALKQLNTEFYGA